MQRLGVRGVVCLVVTAACGAAFLWQDAILRGLCRWLDVGEVPACADHVFVLPGEDTYRPIAAAAVLKAGLAEDMLIPQTDVNADVTDGLSPPAADVLSRIVRHRGIPADKIVCLAGASRTTFDDARALCAFLDKRPDDRVIVVTNSYHTRRARFIFRRVLRDNADRLQFVAAPNPGFAEETWWQNRSSANIVLSENLKLAFYVFRYSGLTGWVSSLVVVAILWRWGRHRRRRLPGANQGPAYGLRQTQRSQSAVL